MAHQYVDPDNGKTPEQMLAERNKRLQDVVALKQPDRVPISLGFGYMLPEMGGVTRQEFQDNPKVAQELLEKASLMYQPDIAMGAFGFGPGASIALGDQMTKWPGYGLPKDGSFQFAEQEFMKPEDYDKFLADPSDWAIRTYLPRAFSKLGGLATLPPFGMLNFGFYHLGNLMSYANPAAVESLKAVAEAIQVTCQGLGIAIESGQRMANLGFAAPFFLMGALIEAPFDFMSDTLRGMRGIFLDMLRRPEKLLAAEQKVLQFEVEHAVNTAKATGLPFAFIPLHRGSDGFMSLPQFEKFYWPQLKSLMLQLVDAGITPSCFYEGIWDQRLQYLAELPKGKTLGWFQNSDIFKVKEVLGDTMCILGGMPNSMLQGGTVEQVRDFTKKLCQVAGKGGGYIMGTNIGEMEGSKPELVRAWVDATKEFGVY
ncbi:MAG: uroporphyrinogen decarboxylase family protein [Anaerolineaceae bacterium]|nr:uroporphyrinogen decarboxylase family protein [Anaerolineaceae bacterium]